MTLPATCCCLPSPSPSSAYLRLPSSLSPGNTKPPSAQLSTASQTRRRPLESVSFSPERYRPRSNTTPPWCRLCRREPKGKEDPHPRPWLAEYLVYMEASDQRVQGSPIEPQESARGRCRSLSFSPYRTIIGSSPPMLAEWAHRDTPVMSRVPPLWAILLMTLPVSSKMPR